MQFCFRAAANGIRRSIQSPDRFPGCLALMRQAERAFALRRRDIGLVQVMCRQYSPTQCLGLHIDSVKLFDEPVLSVVLRCGSSDGLVLRKPGPWNDATSTFVDERPGLATCLEGTARYEYGHEVPPVTARRLSLTWRWFREEALDELLTNDSWESH